MAHLTQSFAWLDQQAFEATLEEVTAFTTKPVEAIGEGGLEPLHASDQISVRSFDREMIVVAHDDEGMEKPVGFLAVSNKQSSNAERVFSSLKTWAR